MTTAVVLLLLVLVTLVAATRRQRTPRPEEPAGTRIEGIPSIGKQAAPDGWVSVRGSLGPEEALVARGLLEASGIHAALQSTDPMVLGMYPVPAREMRLYVAPEDAEAAVALLATEVTGERS
jgi:hypothetical protein